MKTVHVLIADDHELVREGVRARIESQSGWTVCAEASDGRQAVELALRHRPDVVVLDISMKELNGIEAARQIRKACPETEVLILTMMEAEDLMRDALAAGARGFLLKTDASQHLVSAIEALVQHRPYFTGAAANAVLAGYLDPEQAAAGAARDRLTPREREVVQLLAEGRTSKEVAASLGISVSTVEAHRANIMRKLNVHSVAELVRFAVRNKIVPL